MLTAAALALSGCGKAEAAVPKAKAAATSSAPAATPASDSGPPSAPMLRIEAGMHTALVRRIATDAAGRFAVTASDDKTARVWDVASGQPLRVLRPPIGPGNEGKLNAVALSPDGAVVAAAGWTELGSDSGHTVYLFERASGQLRARLGGLPNVIYHLAFSPDGRWLAATLGGGQGVRVWDWRQGGAPLEGGDFGATSYGASWSGDGRLAVSGYDGTLRLFRPQGKALAKLAQAKAPGGQRPYGVAFAPGGASLAVGYADAQRVDVLDGHTLALLFSPTSQGVDNGALSSVAWSRDGQTLAAGGGWSVAGRHPVRHWPQAGRGPAQDTPSASNTLLDLAPLPGGGWLVAAFDPAWGVLAADGGWQAKGKPPVADLRASLGDAFLLGDGAGALQFGYEQWGKPPHQFDLRRRQLAPGPLPGGAAPRTSGLALKNWEDSTSPTLQGKPLALEQYETARSLALAPDAASFALGTDYWLRHFASDGTLLWQHPVPGNAWGVNIPPSGRVLVAAYGDGTIRWHRLSDGQALLAFFPAADRKRWVLWTPSGYYDASPGGEDLIGWHLNRGQDQAADFFPASRFRATYHRPDVIDQVLETLDEAKALANANDIAQRKPQARPSVAQTLPPALDLLSNASLSSAQATVKVRVRSRSAVDAPPTNWIVRVNGQALPALGGPGQQSAAQTAAPGTPAGAPGEMERSFDVPIPPQDSSIEIFAENRHGISTAASVRVVWAGKAAAPAIAKPTLYLLAVGVTQYKDEQFNGLRFAHKDAADFAAAMQAQQGKLYGAVQVRLLTNEQASADAVVDGLEWLRKVVRKQDIGMAFFAGHGINDNGQGYSFLPADANPDRSARTYISTDVFRRNLSNMEGKALFFFDSCHSGNILGMRGRNKDGRADDVVAVVNELASAENGVVVFSSSTGRQLSFEKDEWQNGAFTKALVEGINGAADTNKTGRITHTMLDGYIKERVRKLTGGQQSPVTQAPNGVPDYPLAMPK